MITWDKPDELDSLDFGNPGPERRKDILPSQAPVKNKLTSTITQLLKDHFDKKNNNDNANNIREKVAKTNNVTLFSIDAMTDEEKERLRLKPVEVNSDAELIPFNTLTKPTEQQSEPLIFNIKRPSYAPPASSYTTTTTIAPTVSYSYGNNTGYGGSPIVVGFIMPISNF